MKNGFDKTTNCQFIKVSYVYWLLRFLITEVIIIFIIIVIIMIKRSFRDDYQTRRLCNTFILSIFN